jgi:hypothetical protein
MQYEVVKNTVEIKFNNGKIDHKAVFTGSNKGLKVEIQIVTESDTRVMTLTAEKTDMIACRMLVRSVINILKEYGRPITRV